MSARGAGGTAWAVVWAATFAGVAAAMQVGKAAATLPLLREATGAGLTTLALYVSAISAVAASAGFAFGGLAGRLGPRRAGVAGLGLMAVGSAGGAAAPGMAALLASRVPEALGFALLATAMPALIGRACAPRDRALALGVWATWLPLGMAAAMAAALAAPAIGWRGVFLACALAPALAIGLLLRAAPSDETSSGRPRGPAARRMSWPSVTAFGLAAAFAAFSAANMVVVAFLPTLLHDELAFTPGQGAAMALAANLALVPGNLVAGWLRGREVGGRALMAGAFLGMLACAAALLAGGAPAPVRLGAALLFGLFAGVPPAVVWGSIALVARSAAQAPLVSGLFYQGAGLGQIAGPLLAAHAVAQGGGWDAAIWVVAGTVAAGLALVASLPASLYAAGLPGRPRPDP